MFGGNFAPAGWMFCDGQLLPIAENDALFALIGTTYGGDGQSTFALPDLRGRLPIHNGSNGFGTHTIGETGGVEQVTVAVASMPSHAHAHVMVASGAEKRSPKNALFAATKQPLYAPPGAMVPLDTQVIGPAGGSQPHENVQPFLCVSFIISLFGIFPSQS